MVVRGTRHAMTFVGLGHQWQQRQKKNSLHLFLSNVEMGAAQFMLTAIKESVGAR